MQIKEYALCIAVLRVTQWGGCQAMRRSSFLLHSSSSPSSADEDVSTQYVRAAARSRLQQTSRRLKFDSAAPQLWNYDKQGEDWIHHLHCDVDDKRQSPIHFSSGAIDLPFDATKNLTLHYNDTFFEYDLHRTKHSFRIVPRTAGAFGYAVTNGVRFDVVEGHFHAPAEHTFGKNPEWRRGLEYHLVHKENEGDRLLVVGITFVARPDGSNPLLNRLMNLDALAEGARKTRTIPLEHMEFFRMKETGADAYYYPGSLTTPPCTANVEWYVMRKPLIASQEQIDSFDTYLRADNSLGNFRVQQNVGNQQNNYQKVWRTSLLNGRRRVAYH